MTDDKTNIEYGAIAATLGMKDATIQDVMSRISELTKVEAELNQVKIELNNTKTILAGKDASIQNLEKTKNELSESLKAYQQMEAEEKRTKIEKLVNDAVEAGKIDLESKANWMEMASANLELAQNTLNSIPAREQISKGIATDKENIQSAADAAKTADTIMEEKVTEVVGKDFRFGKLT